MATHGDNFVVRIRTPEGGDYAAELGAGYNDDQVRMEQYENGIVVRHPGKDPVYINGSTRQVGKDPEICRGRLIIAPANLDMGREHKPDSTRKMDTVLGRMRK